MSIEEHKVRDGKRLLTFEGWLLGAVSSQRPGNPRWTEIRLFKTVGSSYVLEKLGASIVMHEPGCPEIIGDLPRFQEEYPGEDPEQGFVFDSCVADTYDFTTLLVERPIYWATIAEDPNKIVAALYRERDGIRHLPRISIDLLEAAAANDQEINDAYRVERIF